MPFTKSRVSRNGAWPPAVAATDGLCVFASQRASHRIAPDNVLRNYT